jgi:hypothetical protein
MKKFFLIFFFAVAVSILAWYGYPIIKNRYFQPAPLPTQNKVEIKNETPENTTPEEQKSSEATTPQENNTEEQKSGTNISSDDCDNECASYSGSQLEYCQQVCGLAAPQQNASDNCDNLSGLNKDYCLKDLAVSKKDYKICNQIQDSNIKKTCTNRVTEDLIGN